MAHDCAELRILHADPDGQEFQWPVKIVRNHTIDMRRNIGNILLPMLNFHFLFRQVYLAL